MSPQLENGHIRIANELFEAFYRCKLSEYERILIMVVWRKTYGFGKKFDWIANSQFVAETGIQKQHVNRTLKKLKERKMVLLEGRKLSINKSYHEWGVEWRGVAHRGYSVARTGYKKLPLQAPTKDSKDNIQKTQGETSSAKKDMNWNNKSDDYEEGYIDLDGSGEILEKKEAPRRKYPNAPAVRKIFQEVLGRNPANWRVNKTQLQACENLSTERGLDKIKSALEYYQENKDDTFCPTINSPYDLDSKWTNLGEHKLKNQ